MITKDMTLADVVKAYPNTIGFLNGLHLDYCCGGHDPIATAVREKGLDVDKFLAELNQAAERKAAQRDVHGDIEAFKTLAVTEMLDDLEATHHVTDRRLMAETEELLNKILIVHYPHHGKMLTRLHHLYAGLKAELEEHFAKEEQLVFPLMRQHPHPDSQTLALIQDLEAEHTGAGTATQYTHAGCGNNPTGYNPIPFRETGPGYPSRPVLSFIHPRMHAHLPVGSL